MIDEYVADGRLKLEYRDYAFLGQRPRPDGSTRPPAADESIQAAVAAGCAADQGEFWRYHDSLYLNQNGENQGAFAGDRLRTIAREIGLDQDAFDRCLEDPARAEMVAASRREGQALGVQSTPSFFVAGQRVEWTDQYRDVKAAIDAALETAADEGG